MKETHHPITKRRKKPKITTKSESTSRKRKRSSSGSKYTKATQKRGANKGPTGPKKQSLKRLIKTYYPGARVTEQSLFKYSEFSYKLLHLLASQSISLTLASRRHTLLFDHVLQTLRIFGIEKASDSKFKVQEIESCEINKTPAKQIQSRVNREFRGKNIVNIDTMKNMKLTIDHHCITLQKASFRKMLQQIINDHNLGVGMNLRFSKKAVELLQLAFERELLTVISGSMSVANARAPSRNKNTQVIERDIDAAEFISALEKKAKFGF